VLGLRAEKSGAKSPDKTRFVRTDSLPEKNAVQTCKAFLCWVGWFQSELATDFGGMPDLLAVVVETKVMCSFKASN